MVQKIWSETGRQPDLFGKIDNMLMRIRHERSSGSDFLDFKTGEGGLIEAEFLVQALQMRAGIWNPNWRNALAALRDDGVVSSDEAATAARSYAFLRRCEAALRRWEMKNVSALPAGPDEQRRLAARLGYEKAEAFAKEYVDLRKAIHNLYDRCIRNAAD
jgi:glutamine synthetase adenylyltransferase